MEDKKKPILIGVIVGCLVLAAIITFATNKPGGGDKKKLEETTLIKCRNCNAVYELPIKDYQEQMTASGSPRIICKECGKKTAIGVTKCEKCGHLYRKGLLVGPDVYEDQCPKCGYSKIRERREAARQ